MVCLDSCIFPTSLSHAFLEGIPRARIEGFLTQIQNPMRLKLPWILVQIVNKVDYEPNFWTASHATNIAGALCHKRVGVFYNEGRKTDVGIQSAANLLRDIWRKWDYINDRPFPEGVERVYKRRHNGDISVPVWKNTGSRYVG